MSHGNLALGNKGSFPVENRKVFPAETKYFPVEKHQNFFALGIVSHGNLTLGNTGSYDILIALHSFHHIDCLNVEKVS